MVESKKSWKAWLYLSPVVVLTLIFTAWPIVNTIRMSFLEGYDGMLALGGASFDFGIGNFVYALNYPDFLDCLKNTVLLCVLTVPLSTIIALLIAVALNSIKPLQRILQTIFFLPYVTNSIAIGMVFASMFNIIGNNLGTANELITTPGLINTFLGFFGVDPVNWMNAGSSYWASIAVMTVYIVWDALPFKILVLLGGLQGINKQYYEAAKVDATPKWRVFSRITVPLLSPMITYVVITAFIGGFKEYSSIVAVFGEDMKQGSLNTMIGMLYEALENTEHGLASASALILFVIIFAVTMLNMYVSKRNTHY